MADTQSPTPAANPNPNDPPKRPRSPLNQALVDELSLAEQLIATAAKPAYAAIQGGQTGGQSDASSARTALEAKVKVIAELRREIQYAADTLWPASKKVHAALRTEFQIPPDRGLK